MERPRIPDNETDRLNALRHARILDTPPEPAFDDLVTIATTLCDARMGAVTLVDQQRQWFKARQGFSAAETSRDSAFCAHAILDPSRVFSVEDARADLRFHDNPLVTGEPHIRFYAGAPMIDGDGFPLGTVCVFDARPSRLDERQSLALQALSRQAAHLLELRRLGHLLNRQLDERRWYEQQLSQYYTELESLNADLAEQTRTDPLTGLPNRRAFSAALATALEAAQAGGPPPVVAVLDIDHFKTINDLHGHDQGDHVLVELSALLRSHVAGDGMCARFGGEEFVLLLPNLSLDGARMQCEFLRQSVAALPIGLPVTVSIGLTAMRRGESAQDMLKRADQALYRAKHHGRDQVVAEP